jgi:hypothetical protein
MFRHRDFPFADGRFPDDLGAVVQKTVLEGQEPARYVGHTAENDWVVGDGLNDPNTAGASVATHMRHVIERDSSLAPLATLPAGFQAEREDPDHEWTISPFVWLDE